MSVIQGQYRQTPSDETGGQSKAFVFVQVDNQGRLVVVDATEGSKGSANMAGSNPITIATDDTQFAKITQPTTTAAVTPGDSTAVAFTKGLWVGVGGDLSVKFAGDSIAQTLKNVPSGTYVPGSVIRVMAATTATNIVGFA